jgi:hypothetical protein
MGCPAPMARTELFGFTVMEWIPDTNNLWRQWSGFGACNTSAPRSSVADLTLRRQVTKRSRYFQAAIILSV